MVWSAERLLTAKNYTAASSLAVTEVAALSGATARSNGRGREGRGLPRGKGGRWAVNAAGLLAVVQLEGKFPWNSNDFPRGKGLNTCWRPQHGAAVSVQRRR